MATQVLSGEAITFDIADKADTSFIYLLSQALASVLERINESLQPAQSSVLRLSAFRSIRAPL